MKNGQRAANKSIVSNEMQKQKHCICNGRIVRACWVPVCQYPRRTCFVDTYNRVVANNIWPNTFLVHLNIVRTIRSKAMEQKTISRNEFKIRLKNTKRRNST